MLVLDTDPEKERRLLQGLTDMHGQGGGGGGARPVADACRQLPCTPFQRQYNLHRHTGRMARVRARVGSALVQEESADDAEAR